MTDHLLIKTALCCLFCLLCLLCLASCMDKGRPAGVQRHSAASKAPDWNNAVAASRASRCATFQWRDINTKLPQRRGGAWPEGLAAALPSSDVHAVAQSNSLHWLVRLDEPVSKKRRPCSFTALPVQSLTTAVETWSCPGLRERGSEAVKQLQSPTYCGRFHVVHAGPEKE